MEHNRRRTRTANPVPALLAAAALLAALLIPAAPARAADGLWIHVHVVEDGGATVRVNLPVDFVETAARVLPDADVHGHLRFEDEDITVPELREMWRSLRDGGDALWIDADDDGDKVRVRKAGGYLLIDANDRGDDTRVTARIPQSVVEALLATDGDDLDIAGALRALAAAGEGELVAVDDTEARVRVWVDGSSESR